MSKPRYNPDGSERKFSAVTLKECASPHGLGTVTGKFEAERLPGCDLLDTNVSIEISPFAITWKDKEKFIKELSALIGKFQI